MRSPARSRASPAARAGESSRNRSIALLHPSASGRWSGARPDQWSRWSPYVRGAEGLGTPEVQEGSRGTVLLAGGLRLPAEILEVIPGRSWTWRVGGIVIEHLVLHPHPADLSWRCRCGPRPPLEARGSGIRPDRRGDLSAYRHRRRAGPRHLAGVSAQGAQGVLCVVPFGQVTVLIQTARGRSRR